MNINSHKLNNKVLIKIKINKHKMNYLTKLINLNYRTKIINLHY